MNLLIIKPIGGLSNKLRVIFSYLMYARSISKKLMIIWIISNECNGYFLDYFQDVNDIIFLKNNKMNDKLKAIYPKFKIDNYKIDYIGCEMHPLYKSSHINIYEELILLPKYINKVKHIINKLDNNYIAVHIRRTDHIDLANKYSSVTLDEEFNEFIILNNNNMNLYIATDNEVTQKLFYNKYKNRIKIINHIKNNKYNLRQTSLEDAIIDIFVCSKANYFKGSNYSSFSGLIYNLRNNN